MIVKAVQIRGRCRCIELVSRICCVVVVVGLIGLRLLESVFLVDYRQVAQQSDKVLD